MNAHDLSFPPPPSPCADFGDRRSAVGRLVELAGAVTDTRIAYVWLGDEDGRVCGGARPEPKLRMHARRAVDTGRPVVVHDGFAARGFGPADRDHVVAFVGVPIARADGPVHGALCVVDRRPRMWTTHEVETLETLGRALAAEIELGGERRPGAARGSTAPASAPRDRARAAWRRCGRLPFVGRSRYRSGCQNAESGALLARRSGGTRSLGRIHSRVSGSALPRARARQLTP